jgi:hypothetical protein
LNGEPPSPSRQMIFGYPAIEAGQIHGFERKTRRHIEAGDAGTVYSLHIAVKQETIAKSATWRPRRTAINVPVLPLPLASATVVPRSLASARTTHWALWLVRARCCRVTRQRVTRHRRR